MEKMSPQPQRSPSTVPLARDADGNSIELPEDTVGWRIRRQTGGRPRLVLDSRKQPMLFPLDYTVADVEDVLAPGHYLLDAVDRNGEPLGVTIAVAIGMPRNAGAVEVDNDDVDSAPLVVPTSLPSTTNEVRLVLEANVRATQMAFIHNQRTLETGLRMAETLRDSVQVLASSQADWIKSVCSARGFFRNVAPTMAPVEVKQLTVHTGGDESDDEDADGDAYDGDAANDDGDGGSGGGGAGGGAGSGAGPRHWSEQFMPMINQVLMQVMPAVNAWSAKTMAEARDRRAGAATSNAVDPRVAQAQAEAQRSAQEEPEEQRAALESDEEQRAAQAQQRRAAQIAIAVAAASSPGLAVDIVKVMQLLPQQTSAKIMQIQMVLSPDEQRDAMHILRGYRADALTEVLTVFDQASLDQCQGFMRGLIVEWRGMHAARRAQARRQSPGGGTGGASGPGGASSAGGASGIGAAGGQGQSSGAGARGVGGASQASRTGDASGAGSVVVGAAPSGLTRGASRLTRRAPAVGGGGASSSGGAEGRGQSGVANGVVGPGALLRALGAGSEATTDVDADRPSGALPGGGDDDAGGGTSGASGDGSPGPR